MPHNTLTIEFCHSSSPRFNSILKESQKHPSFMQEGKTYFVTYSQQESKSVYLMADKLKGIRNKRVIIDGQEMPWSEVFCYMWCYALCLRAHDPLKYCMGERSDNYSHYFFNIWRCQQSDMPLWENAEWLTYGHFDTDQLTFIFDKKQIKNTLLRNLHGFRFCPALNTDAMMKTLDAFPETVNPHINKDWKYFDTGIAPRKAKKIYEDILDKFC